MPASRLCRNSGNGLVDKDEFFQAMASLGLDITRAETDELFDTFDPDLSGTIEYRELNKLCRHRATMERKRLNRCRSEVMPPGASRSTLKWLVEATPAGSKQQLAPLGQRGATHLQSLSLNRISTASADRVLAGPDPWMTRPALDLMAEVWFQPRHGGEWRYSRQLGPVRTKAPPPRVRFLRPMTSAV